MKIIVETEDLKVEFSSLQHLKRALDSLHSDRVGERAERKLTEWAEVTYDKRNRKFLKHRTIGNVKANEILEFTR